MSIKINIASQKGGTGKSTLARLIGTAFAAIG
jgi:cellulose biosynthesis protein BcsQ